MQLIRKKILHADNHIGISIVGLTADARLLGNSTHQEGLDSRFVFDRPLPVSRLVSLIGSKTHLSMQRDGWRPYGVVLLIAGYDDMGPWIFQAFHLITIWNAKLCPLGPVLNHLVLTWKDICLSL